MKKYNNNKEHFIMHGGTVFTYEQVAMTDIIFSKINIA